MKPKIRNGLNRKRLLARRNGSLDEVLPTRLRVRRAQGGEFFRHVEGRIFEPVALQSDRVQPRRLGAEHALQHIVVERKCGVRGGLGCELRQRLGDAGWLKGREGAAAGRR